MLNSISWASYLYATSIIVILYYAFVIIIYYRNDLQRIFLSLTSRFISTSETSNSKLEQDAIDFEISLVVEEDQKKILRELLINLQSFIRNGASGNIPKEELLLTLQHKLQHHPFVNNNILQERINTFIITAFENYCSIHLWGEEVSALWTKRGGLEHF